jgi:hypothetical protein
MAGPCRLDSVQLLCGSDVYTHGIFHNARVYACHTTVTELDSVYEENYGGNNPTEAMARETLYLRWRNGAWQSFGFDGTFVYNGSDNLILEFRWQGDNVARSTISGTTRPAIEQWTRDPPPSKRVRRVTTCLAYASTTRRQASPRGG